MYDICISERKIPVNMSDERAPLQSRENLPKQSAGGSKAKSSFGPEYPKGKRPWIILEFSLIVVDKVGPRVKDK